jgi:adenylate kinase family enzyme
VGKSPLGDAIAEKGLFGCRCHHLDFGSELRGAVTGGSRSSAYSTDELDFIHGVLERGLLLENEHFTLARKILALYLNRVFFQQDDVLVLNGIPRHTGQANDIEAIARIQSLIVLDCSAEEVVRRIQDNVGGDRTERVDDNRELIEKKLTIFRERTAPLVLHYEQRGCRIYRLRVTDRMTPGQAYETLSALAAADPPVALVAEPPQR